MASPNRVSTREGERLFQDILYQTTDLGALSISIWGSLGSGKSTLLRTLAESIRCNDPVSGEDQLMTVLWRCHDIDIWNSFNKDAAYLFIYEDDYKYVKFRTDKIRALTKKDLPKIITYTTNQDLYSKLVKGGINCIFEPQRYELSRFMKRVIAKRGADSKLLKDGVKVESSVWWIEFAVWLLRNKGMDFFAIILDEFDEMLSSGVGGIPWHCAHIWRDFLRVSRKQNVCTIMCAHQIKDVNPVILSKVLVNIYLKGAHTAPKSLIDTTAPITIRRGLGFIERDAWGLFKFDKLDMADKVITLFDFPPEDDDFDFLDDDDIDVEDNINEYLSKNKKMPKNICELKNGKVTMDWDVIDELFKEKYATKELKKVKDGVKDLNKKKKRK